MKYSTTHLSIQKQKCGYHTLAGCLLGIMIMACLPNAYAGGNNLNYTAIPPLISSSGGDVPNVLVVLDTSNSMDEAPDGHAVGSDNAGSKSEIARNAVKNIISSNQGRIRMGLMAYQQSSVVGMDLHDSWYDISYNSANYDPNYDLSVPGARDSITKKFRRLKPGSTTEYVYYNVALPFYASSNQGTAYCYSRTANFDNGSETAPTGSPLSGGGPWDAYRCFSSKTSNSNIVPASNGAAETAEGYISSIWGGSAYQFFPTDSDVAQNILDFGARMGWTYVGKTWFSNSTPGRGYLHTPVADLDATQAALLNAKLATSQFSSATDTPLRNAGLTPLEGTLDTALNYYNGVTLPSSEGGTTFSPSVTCTGKNYIVLVTDGLPSTDPTGNPYASTTAAITAVAAKAAQLNAAGTKVYVVGFALPPTVNPTILNTIAVSGGTGVAYSASNSSTLNATLNAIFQDVLNRTSSGSAAAVVANSGQGTGAIYQALYNPKIGKNSTEAKWTGKLQSLFIDNRSYFREDTNGNGQLDDYTTSGDRVVTIYFDTITQTTKIQRYTSSDNGLTLTADGLPLDLSALNTIWEASSVLGGLNQSDIINQRSYATQVGSGSNSGRHIFTTINNNTIDFVWDNTTPTPAATKMSANNYRYLGVSSTTEAQNIVNFVRGLEGIAGYRSRSLDSNNDTVRDEHHLLGDIIHSNPVVVGSPRDGYDIRYADVSYAEFRQKYAKRRQVVYVGSNDGMIHAFNGGFWNASNKSFDVSDGGSAVQHPLGAELWGYIPQNLLPHLQWMKDPNYSHVYYMDGAPLVFDANIFGNDSVHTNGWGTVLVVGMRLGGGAMTVDTNGDSTDDWTTGSAYIVLDITDPESPPTVLAELTDTNLGFTTSGPVAVKKRAASSTGNWKAFSTMTNEWYLVFGSGPGPNDSPTNAQTGITNVTSNASSEVARIYKYNLGDPKKSVSAGYASGFTNGKSTGQSWSFVGGLNKVDWNNDYQDDVVYFGTIGKAGSAASEGGIFRLLMTDDSLPRLYNANKPISAAPLLSTDNNNAHWIHVGSGRLFSSTDNSDITQQVYLGIKEPVVSGLMTYTDLSVSTPATLQNITGVRVFTSGALQDTGSVLPISPSTLTTFNDLELHIENNTAGWYRNFSTFGTAPSTRNLTMAARANRTLFYTDYTPSSNVCTPEGSSNLFSVSLKTGTAEAFASFGTNPLVTLSGAELSIESLSVGQGMASSPITHSGAGTQPSGTLKIITNSSTGVVGSTSAKTPPLSSGRQSWREILN